MINILLLNVDDFLYEKRAANTSAEGAYSLNQLLDAVNIPIILYTANEEISFQDDLHWSSVRWLISGNGRKIWRNNSAVVTGFLPHEREQLIRKIQLISRKNCVYADAAHITVQDDWGRAAELKKVLETQFPGKYMYQISAPNKLEILVEANSFQSAVEYICHTIEAEQDDNVIPLQIKTNRSSSVSKQETAFQILNKGE